MTDPTTPPAAVWHATCGVCATSWEKQTIAPEPTPNATFCPQCRERRLMAPGVLNWRRHEPLPPPIDPATHAAALRVVEAARGAEGMTYRMDKTLREALAAFDAAKGGKK